MLLSSSGAGGTSSEEGTLRSSSSKGSSINPRPSSLGCRATSFGPRRRAADLFGMYLASATRFFSRNEAAKACTTAEDPGASESSGDNAHGLEPGFCTRNPEGKASLTLQTPSTHTEPDSKHSAHSSLSWASTTTRCDLRKALALSCAERRLSREARGLSDGRVDGTASTPSPRRRLHEDHVKFKFIFGAASVPARPPPWAARKNDRQRPARSIGLKIEKETTHGIVC